MIMNIMFVLVNDMIYDVNIKMISDMYDNSKCVQIGDKLQIVKFLKY